MPSDSSQPDDQLQTGEKARLAKAQRERMADCMEAVAKSQSRQAFDELFAYFAPRLRSYMMRLGSGMSEAEDLAQDVMATIWRKAEAFDRKKASVSTWIFRVARNRRIDVHRRVSKPELDPDEPLLQPAAPDAPDIQLDRAQLDERVREELAKLPPEQLELLRAAFYDGLSHSQIADAMDLPLGTVKSRIRLAFNRLREQLGDTD